MESLLHIQGDLDSTLTPLFFVHSVSGLALPLLALPSLSDEDDDNARPVYGISSPIYQYASYKLPSSLEDVAREYVRLIQRDVQPTGPYLLGGWSMGGMIAVKMAAILEAQGEEVLHVLMVDSANPESFPAFADPVELESVASLTYNRVARHLNLPAINAMATSEVSSDEDEEGDENEVALNELVPRMRKHIFQGLSNIADVRPGTFLRDRIESPVTLIKCTSLAKFPPLMSDVRQAAVRKGFQDIRMGWTPNHFERFQTVRFGAQHDSAFDGAHVEELATIMKKVLRSTP